jgi:hypothetical protein
MSRAYTYYIASLEEPDLARHLFHAGVVSHVTANRLDIAQCREEASKDQQREEEYQRSQEAARMGINRDDEYLKSKGI